MKRWIAGWVAFLWRKLHAPNLVQENQSLRRLMAQRQAPGQDHGDDYMDRVAELLEARQMAGVGPWRVSPATIQATDALIRASAERIHSGVPLRESTPPSAVGAYGDIELALQNVEWRREINLSWLEFSRWGIQQIILISRLYYVKNPLINRGVNVCSYYVFGRGVEVSCADEDANDVLRDFFADNCKVLGQTALAELQKRLYYDGQVFFVLFADTQDSGEVKIRTIDTTEVQNIVTNPDDTDEPWLYLRNWSQNEFDVNTGATKVETRNAWYPALGYEPTAKPAKIGAIDVMWDSPVIHMKGGCGVSKWHFDLPKVYAALDWAREARRFLEACASVKQALKQIAMVITTKGGQQALAGIKQQLSTTIGPSSNLWDQNPPAVSGAVFGAGPGTTLEAFNMKGGGGNPDEVRQFKLMVAMVLDIPESFLADMNTSNLATALALDRPTELGFMEKQERWREVLILIATYVLSVSYRAANGKLREAKKATKILSIREARREVRKDGRMVYVTEQTAAEDALEVKCTFPAIREGDLPALVKAITEAMTLENKGGQVVGIDEKVGVRLLFEQLGVEDAQEIVEAMYPDGEYDPDRTKSPLPAPIGRAQPTPGGQPQDPGGRDPGVVDKTVEAATRLLSAIEALRRKKAS